MNRLEEVLISFRDISKNTDIRDVCKITYLDKTGSNKYCVYLNAYQDCSDCILNMHTKLDKQIRILNKLGE